MIWFALTATLAVSPSPPQDGAVPYAADLYAPPPVRPFEAPPGLGAGPAQGDAVDSAARTPLTAAVFLDAYRHSYEAPPTDSALAYDQGVAQAEISMDSRMGPLDGRWRIRDEAGADLMSLILVDRGDGAVEGAWRSGDSRQNGLIEKTPFAPNGVALRLDDGNVLRLSRSGAGWTGVLTTDGQARPVTVAPD